MTVRHRDGIHFDCGEAGQIVTDARSGAGDVIVVYTHHVDESCADALATEYGHRAQPLKRDQRTLAEFC